MGPSEQEGKVGREKEESGIEQIKIQVRRRERIQNSGMRPQERGLSAHVRTTPHSHKASQHHQQSQSERKEEKKVTSKVKDDLKAS